MRNGEATPILRRLVGPLWAGTLVAALIAALILVLRAGGGSGEPGVGGPFGHHLAGLEGRRLAAEVSTMADGGSVHLHARLKLYVDGEPIEIPAGIGIDPSRPPEQMSAVHTHDDSGVVHVEAGDGATLGQFSGVWGVTVSAWRLGPHRASGRDRVRMWVDGDRSRAFGDLVLADGQEIVVAYGSTSIRPTAAE